MTTVTTAGGHRFVKRLRRTLVWAAGLALLALLIIGIVLWVMTRSWYIVSRAEPLLGNLLGGEVSISRAALRGQGVLELFDVVIRAPDLPGEAGEVARIDRAILFLDPAAFRRGRAELESLVLHGVRLRVSEDENDLTSFNFASLAPELEPAGGPVVPPSIEIASGTVELGVHGVKGFAVRATRSMRGTLRPVTGVPGMLAFELDVRADGERESGITINGSWDLNDGAVTMSLEDLMLDAPLREASPGALRAWWDHMELSGDVRRASVEWSPVSGLTASLDVREAGITMPIQSETFWQWYRMGMAEERSGRPRMLVTGGSLVFSGESFELKNLSGRFVSGDPDVTAADLPYEVNLRLFDLPPFTWQERTAWMDHVAQASGFELEFRGRGLEVRSPPGEEPPAIILPAAVVDALQRFRLTEWTLSTTVRAWRDAPQRSFDAGGNATVTPAQVQAEGQAILRRARGAYEGFPYAMDDVAATIDFSHKRITIHEFRGRGSDGATIQLSGHVEPPDRDGAFVLTLRASELPLDDRLRSALPEAQRAVFDAVLHEVSREKLAGAGLLADEAMLAGFARERDVDEEEVPYARLRREAQQRLIDRGPFRLGGRIDVDIVIERPAGGGARPSVSGQLLFDRLGLLYEGVPYPITIERGLIEWSPALMRMRGRDGAPGVRILTEGGGTGMLSGELDLLESDDASGVRVRPRLDIEVSGEPVTAGLLAALPPDRDERARLGDAWPGRALSRMAEEIEHLSLRGVLGYRGVITARDDAAIDVSAAIDLEHGSLVIGPSLVRWMEGDQPDRDSARSSAAPEDPLHVTDVRAAFRATSTGVELVDLSGRVAGGRVRANGAFAFASRFFHVEAAVDDLTMSPELLASVSGSLHGDVDTFRAVHQPEGLLSASLRWKRDEESDVMEAIIRPDRLGLRLDDVPVDLVRTQGAIRIDRSGIFADDMTLSVTTPVDHEGTVSVSGMIASAGSGRPTGAPLTLFWKDGRFASPILRQMLRWSASDGHVALLDDLRPDGSFSLRLNARFPGEDAGIPGRDAPGRLVLPESVELSIAPRDLGVTFNAHRLQVQFQPGGEIRVEPGRITLHEMRGAAAAGTFALDGTITLGSVLDARIDVEAAGRVTSSQIVSLLPDDVASAVRSLSIREASQSRLTNGHLRFVRREQPDGSDWTMQADGELAIDLSAMDIGLDLEDAAGVLDFTVRARRGETPELRIDAHLDQGRVLDQLVHDARFRLSLDESGRVLYLRDLTGRLARGVLVVTADIALREGERHHVDTRIMGAHVASWRFRDEEEDDSGAWGEDEGAAFAAVEFTSVRGDEDSRIGRGILRITHGRVAAIPFALQFFQLLHFSFPSQRMDFAEADFFITGSKVHIERMLMESVTGDAVLQFLIGAGEMDLDARTIDLRFRSRGAVPVLRDLIGGLGDRMATIHVSGSMDDPDTSLIPLPGRGERSTSPILAPPLRGVRREPMIHPMRRRGAWVEDPAGGTSHDND